MSAANRAGGAALSAAVACAESVNVAVPPSCDSRSMASAEKPLAANRPATERMWSVSPRFSWMTRTEPRGLAAAAQAPCRVCPPGPAKVIASVGRAFGPAAADRVGAAGAEADGVLPSSPSCVSQAASMGPAIPAATPRSDNRRNASRRGMSPSA